MRRVARARCSQATAIINAAARTNISLLGFSARQRFFSNSSEAQQTTPPQPTTPPITGMPEAIEEKLTAMAQSINAEQLERNFSQLLEIPSFLSHLSVWQFDSLLEISLAPSAPRRSGDFLDEWKNPKKIVEFSPDVLRKDYWNTLNKPLKPVAPRVVLSLYDSLVSLHGHPSASSVKGPKFVLSVSSYCKLINFLHHSGRFDLLAPILRYFTGPRLPWDLPAMSDIDRALYKNPALVHAIIKGLFGAGDFEAVIRVWIAASHVMAPAFTANSVLAVYLLTSISAKYHEGCRLSNRELNANSGYKFSKTFKALAAEALKKLQNYFTQPIAGKSDYSGDSLMPVSRRLLYFLLAQGYFCLREGTLLMGLLRELEAKLPVVDSPPGPCRLLLIPQIARESSYLTHALAHVYYFAILLYGRMESIPAARDLCESGLVFLSRHKMPSAHYLPSKGEFWYCPLLAPHLMSYQRSFNDCRFSSMKLLESLFLACKISNNFSQAYRLFRLITLEIPPNGNLHDTLSLHEGEKLIRRLGATEKQFLSIPENPIVPNFFDYSSHLSHDHSAIYRDRIHEILLSLIEILAKLFYANGRYNELYSLLLDVKVNERLFSPSNRSDSISPSLRQYFIHGVLKSKFSQRFLEENSFAPKKTQEKDNTGNKDNEIATESSDSSSSSSSPPSSSPKEFSLNHQSSEFFPFSRQGLLAILLKEDYSIKDFSSQRLIWYLSLQYFHCLLFVRSPSTYNFSQAREIFSKPSYENRQYQHATHFHDSHAFLFPDTLQTILRSLDRVINHVANHNAYFYYRFINLYHEICVQLFSSEEKSSGNTSAATSQAASNKESSSAFGYLPLYFMGNHWNSALGKHQNHWEFRINTNRWAAGRFPGVQHPDFLPNDRFYVYLHRNIAYSLILLLFRLMRERHRTDLSAEQNSNRFFTRFPSYDDKIEILVEEPAIEPTVKHDIRFNPDLDAEWVTEGAEIDENSPSQNPGGAIVANSFSRSLQLFIQTRGPFKTFHQTKPNAFYLDAGELLQIRAILMRKKRGQYNVTEEEEKSFREKEERENKENH